MAVTRRSAPALQLAQAAGQVVGNDLPEHRGESGRVDALSFAYGYGAGGLVVVTGRNDPVRVSDNAAVVKEYVDVILRRQQRADVALEDEVRLRGALDGFGHLRVGAMDQVT